MTEMTVQSESAKIHEAIAPHPPGALFSAAPQAIARHDRDPSALAQQT
jgi:hypothetical protein